MCGGKLKGRSSPSGWFCPQHNTAPGPHYWRYKRRQIQTWETHFSGIRAAAWAERDLSDLRSVIIAFISLFLQGGLKHECQYMETVLQSADLKNLHHVLGIGPTFFHPPISFSSSLKHIHICFSHDSLSSPSCFTTFAFSLLYFCFIRVLLSCTEP